MAQKYILIFSVLCVLPFFSIVQAADEHVWLHVEGQYIRKSLLCDDPNGIWMGCGAAHRCNSTSEESNMGLQQNKVNWIAGNGVNLVRISANNLTDWPSAANYVNNYLAPLVDWYKAKKIYCIIDSHYFMRAYSSYDSVPNYASPFWDVNNASATLCRRWLDDWVYIADYFKDEPWVAGYELCNEPVVASPNPIYAGTVAKCRNNYLECIRRIRQVDKKHIFFIGNGNFSHAVSIKEYWEDGLSASERYNPDPGYGQVVFTFHEYTQSMKLYASAGGYVNDELGRIQNTFHVPLMCTEFGHDDVIYGLPDSEKRLFEQEMIEMCYGQPDFWKNAPLADKAYPSRGIPAVNHIGWIMWRAAGYTSADFTNSSRWTDIWTYAAALQGSPVPNPIADPTPPPVQISSQRIQVKAYPNPCDINKAGNITLEMSVDGTSQLLGCVNIFSLDGKLVRTLLPSGTKADWDGKNDSGDNMSAGIYLFSVTDTNGRKKTGKIALLK
ncbi:MAG: hypothetical protein A2297_01070 [Elusimicrobia bacterium RIFOXYB2_FULL_48_7]|nr:MAG: hypothetical protein A2297_01070 [Elusimicrobia bacterium RIFOXYB2_FULL_48_7]